MIEWVDAHAGSAAMVLISFLAVWVARRRGEPAVVLIALAGVTAALHAVSFANAFDGPLPGAHWDAQTFHREAARLAAAGDWPPASMGTTFYIYLLTGAYRLFGSALLVGQSLSVAVAGFTLLVVNCLAAALGMSDARVRAAIVLVVGLYPTFLYHHALTFREPFELLGLAVVMLCMIKALSATSLKWLAGALPGLAFMGLFHHVLLGIAVVLACLFVVFRYVPKPHRARQLLLPAVLLATVGAVGYVAVTSMPSTSGNDYIRKLSREPDLAAAIIHYRQTIESRAPRTSYDRGLDDSSWHALTGGLLLGYLDFLSRPFAWNLERAADLVPFASALGRLVLLAAFLWLALARGAINRELGYCLAAYLVVTAVWSLGTTNYGQAFRHHALSDWLLILMTTGAWCRRRRRRHTPVADAGSAAHSSCA